MTDQNVPDNDLLDSTGIDFAEDPTSDEDLVLVVLSPEGDPAKIQAYELFSAGLSPAEDLAAIEEAV